MLTIPYRAAAYNHTAYDLFLPALILSFVPLGAGLMTTNFYLGDEHNATESKKIVLRAEEEVKEEVVRKNAKQIEAAIVAPRTA